MAWIYLAESVDYPLPLHLGPHLLPIVNVTDSAKANCCPECGRVTLRAPQSGTMCERCIGKHSRAESTLSGEDFLARIYPSQELEEAWTESEADSSLIYSAWFASWSQDSSSWKTSQLSFTEGTTAFSGPWPAWGTMQGGLVFQQQKLEPSIFVNDGSFLPTPTACDYGKNQGRKTEKNLHPRDRYSITCLARKGELRGQPTGLLHPEWIEQAMGYPIKWTELTDWATQWFRPKRAKRSSDLAV